MTNVFVSVITLALILVIVLALTLALPLTSASGPVPSTRQSLCANQPHEKPSILNNKTTYGKTSRN